MHLQHEEIEAQYCVELAELAISLEEMVDMKSKTLQITK